MYHSTTVVVLLVVAMVTTAEACSSRLPEAELRQMYCNADLVFRGRKVSGSSGSFFIPKIGGIVQGESARINFEVTTMYKGASNGQDTISVSHTWTSEEPCPKGAFIGASDFLVFSKGGSVEPCRHNIPWECVCPDFKSNLPFRASWCGSS